MPSGRPKRSQYDFRSPDGRAAYARAYYAANRERLIEKGKKRYRRVNGLPPLPKALPPNKGTGR